MEPSRIWLCSTFRIYFRLEQTGLISQVGAWVLEAACKQRGMEAGGIGEIPVSVNCIGKAIFPKSP